LCIAVFLNFVSSQQDAIQAGKGDKFLSPTICNVTHLLHTKELYKSKLEKRKKERRIDGIYLHFSFASTKRHATVLWSITGSAYATVVG
jgi:hypothetical protein